jgi:hypothetical protein
MSEPRRSEALDIDLSLRNLLLAPITFPVKLPVKGLLFVFEKIADAVDQERLNEDKVRGMLMELQLRYELEEMSEEEYVEQEEELLKWLNAIREYKKAQAE